METIRTSWECSRCRQINAPHADHCSCHPNAALGQGGVIFIPITHPSTPMFPPLSPFQYPTTVPTWPTGPSWCGHTSQATVTIGSDCSPS